MVAYKDVLIVEDNDDQRDALAITAAQWGYSIHTAANGAEAIEKLTAHRMHVVVTDLAMPRLDGVGLLKWMKDLPDAPPAIVMTAFHDMNKAVTVVHELGAFWFLEKPFDPEVLRALLERAAALQSVSLEKTRLERRLAYNGILGDMVGGSQEMQRVFALVQQVAPTSVSALITGESGTGKEVVANTIHKLSTRRDGPFIAVNCAALPETLMESELFGHEKGSFTGAVERRPGCFELAHGGTLLLDEIGEMPVLTQAKLLRVLEDHKVRRLGGKTEIQVDVRVLAATNKNPETAIRRGELREDLYYRLNVFHISLPPLRDRKDDLPLLAAAVLESLNKKHGCRVTGLDSSALDEMQRYSWPGNVRELRNVLERAVIIAGQGMITPQHLSWGSRPAPETNGNGAHPPEVEQDGNSIRVPVGTTVAEAEHQLVLKTLEHTGYNKARAAKMLGMSLKTLYNKLK
jgi:DNA-binding NtrC family response regulator